MYSWSSTKSINQVSYDHRSNKWAGDEWMWSDIWNVSYIELRIWNQVSYDDYYCDDLNSQMKTFQRQWFIAQLIRASHRYREVTGSNPVELLPFSGFYTQLLKLRLLHCDDRSSLDFKSAVQCMKHFIYITFGEISASQAHANKIFG